MKQVQFKGTGVALVTPFKNGKIDFTAFEKIIEHTLEGGVEYVVPLGTTGEAVTLSSQECREVLDFTIRTVSARVPVVAGFFGHNDTASLARKMRNYNFDGISAVLSSSPAYSKPSQEGIYQHFMTLSDASPVPIIMYNVPGRTCSNVSPETTVRLAKASKKIVAIKEASGDMVHAMKILKDKPDHFQVLSGDDPTAMPFIACGGDGIISVIANAYPRTFSDMIRAALAGNFAKAKTLNDQLLNVHQWLYVEGNPVGIKAAMEILGMCNKDVRLPLVPQSAPNYDLLKSEMERVEKMQPEGASIG
ncbi:MAG: 4-hydroxy-tetrahydrodipicolinate synthase [Bacteroidota bacterium]